MLLVRYFADRLGLWKKKNIWHDQQASVSHVFFLYNYKASSRCIYVVGSYLVTPPTDCEFLLKVLPLSSQQPARNRFQNLCLVTRMPRQSLGVWKRIYKTSVKEVRTKSNLLQIYGNLPKGAYFFPKVSKTDVTTSRFNSKQNDHFSLFFPGQNSPKINYFFIVLSRVSNLSWFQTSFLVPLPQNHIYWMHIYNEV